MDGAVELRCDGPAAAGRGAGAVLLAERCADRRHAPSPPTSHPQLFKLAARGDTARLTKGMRRLKEELCWRSKVA